MTRTKPAHPTACKSPPKRAFPSHSDGNNLIVHDVDTVYYDGALQATNMRRRYMRRGSKSASMLHILKELNFDGSPSQAPQAMTSQALSIRKSGALCIERRHYLARGLPASWKTFGAAEPECMSIMTMIKINHYKSKACQNQDALTSKMNAMHLK